jgi:hypothetical protein
VAAGRGDQEEQQREIRVVGKTRVSRAVLFRVVPRVAYRASPIWNSIRLMDCAVFS